MKNLSLLKCLSILWILLIPFVGYSQSINQSYPAAAGYTPYAVEASADGYHILSLKNRDTLIIEVDDKGQQLGIQKRDVVKAPIPPPGVSVVERVNNNEFMYMYDFGTTTLGLARVDQNGVTIDAASVTFPDSLFTNEEVEDYVEAQEILEDSDGNFYLKVKTGDGFRSDGYFTAKISIDNGLGKIHWVHTYPYLYGFNKFALAKDGNFLVEEAPNSKTTRLYKLDSSTGEVTLVDIDNSSFDAGFSYIDDFEDGCTLLHDHGDSNHTYASINLCGKRVSEYELLAYWGVDTLIDISQDAINMLHFAVEEDYFLISGNIKTRADKLEPYLAKAYFDGTIDWIKILDFDLGYKIHEMNAIDGRIFISGLKYGTPFLYEVNDYVDLELLARTNLELPSMVEINQPFMLTLEVRNTSTGNFTATDIIVDIPNIPDLEILGTELSEGTIINTSTAMQWKIPILPANTTATAMFSITATDYMNEHLFAEVLAANTLLADDDSTPNNGNGYQMLEDDEISMYISCINDDDDCDRVVLSSQKEVDQFTCTHVERLIIDGDDITDLSPLANIEVINKLELIKLNTNDWSVFDDIAKINNISIATDIGEIKDAFNKTTHLKSLVIKNTDDLERISNSFQQVQKVEALSIYNNHKLLSVGIFPTLYEASIYISRNDVLSIDNMFNALVHARNLNIRNNNFSNITNSFQNLKYLDIMSFSRNDNLGTIPNFPQLTTLTRLTIEYNPNIHTITGFSRLIDLKELYIESNEKLHTITGFSQLTTLDKLNIKHNLKFQMLNNTFNSLKTGGYIEIVNNRELSEISNSFQQLEEVSVLKIADDPLLTTIFSFANLEVANSIRIENNKSLINIGESFSKLERLERLGIINNSSLEDLGSSFPVLKSLTKLEIRSNQKLKKLPVFPHLLTLGEIWLASLSTLTEISNWLNNITSVTVFRLSFLSSLTRINNSFNQLEKIEKLHFYGNESLEVLNNSFANTKEIQYLSITQNSQLRSLADFSNLKRMDRIRIEENPLLDDCCCLAYFIRSNDSDIANNAPNCNSKTAIREHCPAEDPLADLVISNIRNLVPEAAAGEVLGFNFDLKNIGTGLASGDYKIEAYLRGPKRYLVGELLTGNTPIGTIRDVYGAITIPENIIARDYYLELIVDTGDDIKESLENNNTLSSTFRIEIENCIVLPDLAIDNIKNLPEKIGRGELLNFQFDLINNSSATAWGNYEIGMYFSKKDNNNIIRPDILLGTITTGNTASGKIGNIDISWPVPDDIAEGEYCLKIRADINNEIVESSSYNNTRKSDAVICIGAGSSATEEIPDIGIEKESPSIFDIEVSTIPEAAHLITKIYPNPVQYDLHIQVESKEKTSSKLVVYNSIGQVVLEELVNLQKGRNELTFSLSDLQAGIYFAQIGVEQTTLSFVKN